MKEQEKEKEREAKLKAQEEQEAPPIKSHNSKAIEMLLGVTSDVPTPSKEVDFAGVKKNKNKRKKGGKDKPEPIKVQ